MKNVLSFLLTLPLFISCGGGDSSKESTSSQSPSEIIICEGEKTWNGVRGVWDITKIQLSP